MLERMRAYALIFAFAAASRLIVRLPLGRLESVVELRRRPTPLTPEEIDLLAGRVERVLWATRSLRHNCLTRGVTRYYFLRRAGADVRLVFGIGEIGDRYAGHCWLLRDGEIYQEASDPALRFADVIALPSA